MDPLNSIRLKLIFFASIGSLEAVEKVRVKLNPPMLWRDQDTPWMIGLTGIMFFTNISIIDYFSANNQDNWAIQYVS